MTKDELFKMMNENPVMNLATVDEKGQPHVREILMYSADERGIIFHTGEFKDLYKQLKNDGRAEVCFMAKGVQIRAEGNFEEITGDEIFDEIYSHPSREFMKAWGKRDDVKKFVKVFAMKSGRIHTWSMASNFEPKDYVSF